MGTKDKVTGVDRAELEERERRARVKLTGNWRRADIPERIIKKLARVAGLKYKDGHKAGGGGLCLEIDGVKPRRKAMMVLGMLVGRIGEESTNKSVEEAGATWLDVMGWREDVEYSLLWRAAILIKREVAAARLEDELWERSLNGYEVQEAKSIGGELEMVHVHRMDNGLGVQLLKGLGFVGRGAVGSRSAKGVTDSKVDPVAKVDGGGINESADTVLFPSRKVAYDMMGESVTTGDK